MGKRQSASFSKHHAKNWQTRFWTVRGITEVKESDIKEELEKQMSQEKTDRIMSYIPEGTMNKKGSRQCWFFRFHTVITMKSKDFHVLFQANQFQAYILNINFIWLSFAMYVFSSPI